jgi:hypothetical protein
MAPKQIQCPELWLHGLKAFFGAGSLGACTSRTDEARLIALAALFPIDVLVEVALALVPPDVPAEFPAAVVVLSDTWLLT